MERHHRGTLPKSYYAPNGELYADALFYGKRNDRQYKRDIAKEKEGEERAKYKIASQMKQAQAERDKMPDEERIRKAKEATKIIKKKMGRK